MASSIYLKLDSITGDATQKGHTGEIEVTSFSWGQQSPRDPATGQATGKSQFKPLDIKCKSGRQTPSLIQSAAGNSLIKTATLTVWEPDATGLEKAVFTYQLAGLGIASISFSCEQSSALTGTPAAQNSKGVPEESISFTYQKIQLNYTGGTNAASGWDVAANQKI